MSPSEVFHENLKRLELRIKNACAAANRPVAEVELMAVTKTHPAAAADLAVAAGLRRIGENRVQEAAGKRPEAQRREALWELIGPLQSNKSRLALETFDRIQTVDRIKLVHALDRLCAELGRTRYPVLLQVNVGDDPAKHGCQAGAAEALAAEVLASGNLVLDGLMTIGELTQDERVIRSTFARLRGLRDALQSNLGVRLPVLSMGMTDDLEWAIAEGSTLIRVGTALFGQR